MKSKLRRPLLSLGVASLLLVGVSACAVEFTEPAGDSGQDGATGPAAQVLSQPEDAARNRELAARYAQEVATEDDRLRAEQGDANAQALLAVVYYNGRGVELDYEEAVRWAWLAAEQDNARGQSLLAAAYYSGNGIAQDHEEAARWAQLAAEQGSTSAQALLGVLYFNGAGAPQDDVSAYMWLTVAAASSETPGPGRLRDLLAKRMTPDQVAEAEARARNRN